MHVYRLWSLEMERVTGIEPAYLAWEASALPLSYTRVQTAVKGVYLSQDPSAVSPSFNSE